MKPLFFRKITNVSELHIASICRDENLGNFVLSWQKPWEGPLCAFKERRRVYLTMLSVAQIIKCRWQTNDFDRPTAVGIHNIARLPYFTLVYFKPFCFNAPCQSKLLNLRPHFPFKALWLVYFHLLKHFWWEYHFWFAPTFSGTKLGCKTRPGVILYVGEH
jgi:hypothetical protein